jgi:hypothetical protein
MQVCGAPNGIMLGKEGLQPTLIHWVIRPMPHWVLRHCSIDVYFSGLCLGCTYAHEQGISVFYWTYRYVTRA